MGLTKNSVNIDDLSFTVKKHSKNDKVIALAGNPNVGKSTVFNNLTGMNQHTGNWPGKTVTNAQGYLKTENMSFVFVDIPGTYSLMAHSAEEEVARNFICFSKPDVTVVVCDATCLERNLNLVLQTLEVTPNVVLCLNLIDEAKRKGIKIDTNLLSKKLKIPVVPCVARKKNNLKPLVCEIEKAALQKRSDVFKVKYSPEIEEVISKMMPALEKHTKNLIDTRWLCIRLLDGDKTLINEMEKSLGIDLLKNEEIQETVKSALKELKSKEISRQFFKDLVVSSIVSAGEKIAKSVTTYKKEKYSDFDRKTDAVLTSRRFGYPIMILLLLFVFWLTISGANYPSKILSDALFKFQDILFNFLAYIRVPKWVLNPLIFGVYHVLAWVVSVMLPPMAIFFPLFTLLEDVGYLPRIAYNLDKPFKKCCACGKQSLTMCMGFGCNAAGVVGCRIIDSKRERLLAILTNSFVPCNGRFPALVSIITMFFIGASRGFLPSVKSAVFLTGIILLSVAMTFLMTKILSKTLLKGYPSSFALEMPPYRRPQVGKIIVRSIFDRTLFVLSRAALVAAPAGLIIWIMANASVNGINLLTHCASFLDPFAHLLGLDGVILMAFILGFPANEIVIPIIIMAYTASGTITDFDNLQNLNTLFVSNGWTLTTAMCFVIFTLFHWPCSTTLLTVKKETVSIKWTLLAALLPTLAGILLCAAVNFIMKIFV